MPLHPLRPRLTGVHVWMSEQVLAGAEPVILHIAAGRYGGHVSGRLIDARSVSSLRCVSDTSRNKRARCSPPPQFTATPPPGDSEGSLSWHETAHGVTSQCLDPSWLRGQGLGLLYASSWQTPTSALCSYQLTSLAQKVSSQGETETGRARDCGRREEKRKKQPSFFKSQVISVLWRVRAQRQIFLFFFYQQQKVLCSC